MKIQQEVWDREDLLVALQAALEDEGGSICLLGGNSTGIL